MSKPEYYRIYEDKEIHITSKIEDISAAVGGLGRLSHYEFECGRKVPLRHLMTKCFRPNSLDSVCRGCRSAW